ncbi:hypothetical protein K7X08_020286 [Anisodus acutangulus]|uniref:Uncharacterized protein n=1 Tax=Anisodus acutangulus TaxID=402998 RepID=A0A9Q1RF86_9SOLA|nr:hypothetical protein K7X08_020286 [Anisodus acutangulus]
MLHAKGNPKQDNPSDFMNRAKERGARRGGKKQGNQQDTQQDIGISSKNDNAQNKESSKTNGVNINRNPNIQNQYKGPDHQDKGRFVDEQQYSKGKENIIKQAAKSKNNISNHSMDKEGRDQSNEEIIASQKRIQNNKKPNQNIKQVNNIEAKQHDTKGQDITAADRKPNIQGTSSSEGEENIPDSDYEPDDSEQEEEDDISGDTLEEEYESLEEDPLSDDVEEKLVEAFNGPQTMDPNISQAFGDITDRTNLSPRGTFSTRGRGRYRGRGGRTGKNNTTANSQQLKNYAKFEFHD